MSSSGETIVSTAAADVHIPASSAEPTPTAAVAAAEADICSFTRRDRPRVFCLKIKCPTRL